MRIGPFKQDTSLEEAVEAMVESLDGASEEERRLLTEYTGHKDDLFDNLMEILGLPSDDACSWATQQAGNIGQERVDEAVTLLNRLLQAQGFALEPSHLEALQGR